MKHSTKESVLALTELTEKHPPAATPTYSQAAAKAPVVDPATRITLVIKGTGPTPDKKIETMLAQENIAVSIRINKVAPKKNHVEITCKSESDLRKLQSELQKTRTSIKN